MNTQKLLQKLLILAIFSSANIASAKVLSSHIIKFGGTNGKTYFPNSLNVLVGDTIKWIGDFSTYPLQSTSIPSGANSFGPINVGDTFTYIIKISGEYGYACPKFTSLGMTGGFFAEVQHFGLTNEWREFYLGMLYPSYRSVEPTIAARDFKTYALISSYYDNEILIGYFDESGKETIIPLITIPKNSSRRIILDYEKMQMDTASDGFSYKACHITSKFPISVSYQSVGASATASYLALPTLSLGKNYVAACYNDNAGNGSYVELGGSPDYVAHKFEFAGGEFIIIATEDLTQVKITPTTATVGGHLGYNSGVAHPYKIQMNKGQCYLVRSNGRSEDNDLSGSLIESSKPVAVISGHENGFLGGTDLYSIEGRDLMIEQMVPVEYWDSIGYVSIPFVESSPPGDAGHGDSYRIYCFDSASVAGHLDVLGITGGYDMTTVRLASPPEKLDVTNPVEGYSLNGKRISVFQYDQRSLTDKAPWPAPSMVTIVPVSRWKKEYSFIVTPSDLFNDKDKFTLSTYINVIAPNFGNVNISINGGTPTTLTNLPRVLGYNNVSSHFPNLKGSQYSVSSSLIANSYYLFSSDPFMVYYSGYRNFATNSGHLGDIKANSHVNFPDEFASPAGMQLNTGVTPSFKVLVDTNCSGWHICVRDTGKTEPGLKAVILIDDPDAVYWQQPGAKYKNVDFSESAPDYYDNSELHPHVHDNNDYCFDVNFVNGLEAASAPLAIVDNLGNAIIVKLDRSAPALKLSTNPPTSKPDSIVFPVKKIGEEICTTFVVKNTAPKNGTALKINSAVLTNSDPSYKVTSITPSLPVSLAAQDSLTLQVCYTPLDSARHRDSLKVSTDCFSFSVSLDAHGSTGLISASDLDFPSITVGETTCKDILIKNVGSAPFTLTKSFVLSDSVNFSVNSALPKLIPIGATVTVNVCFHPQTEGPFSAGIDWGTDLEASFAHSIKSHSSLTGNANPKLGVQMTGSSGSFSIYPNPANGNSAIVTFGNASGGADSQSAKGTDGLRVRPTGDGKATLSMFDVLGREVYHQNILSDISRIEIPLWNIPEGVYYVQLDSPNGSVSQKFVRSK